MLKNFIFIKKKKHRFTVFKLEICVNSHAAIWCIPNIFALICSDIFAVAVLRTCLTVSLSATAVVSAFQDIYWLLLPFLLLFLQFIATMYTKLFTVSGYAYALHCIQIYCRLNLFWYVPNHLLCIVIGFLSQKYYETNLLFSYSVLEYHVISTFKFHFIFFFLIGIIIMP